MDNHKGGSCHTLFPVLRPSGPIQVFADDTFIVEFEDGATCRFRLTTPTTETRGGTCGPLAESPVFDNDTIADSTDLRVLQRAYDKWVSADNFPNRVAIT